MLRVPTKGLVIALFFAWACGGDPPRVVAPPPPPPVQVAPPPPIRARWVFAHPERGLIAKMDLGDGGTLYVGQNGRRELAKGDGPMQDAHTLALEELVGVVKDDRNQFVFVARDGDVFVSKDPLGALDTVRPGPLPETRGIPPRLGSPTTGRSAILGISPIDQRLMRTGDYGVSWQPVDYAGASKPYGRPVSIAMDTKGNGLLLHFPQRLFATHDDGVTWTPIASPGMGARRVRRDGADQIFLEGEAGRRAKLDGVKLVVTTEAPAPLFKPPSAEPGAKPRSERTETRTLLSGDRLVELSMTFREDKKIGEFSVRSALLGERISDKEKGVVAPDLASESLSSHIAGFGSEIVYLRKDIDLDDQSARRDRGDRDDDSEDEDLDEAAKTTTVFVSHNHGTAWQKAATLEGVRPAEGSDVHVAVGPKGWAYVTSLCPPNTSSGSSCSHRQVRPSGALAFEDMVFVEEFSPSRFAFDEVRDKVYVVGSRDNTKYLYESQLSKNKFTRTKLFEAPESTVTALTVDSQGTVRVLAYEPGKQQWVLHRRDQGGKELPKLYLPLDRGTVSFAGARGLLFAGHERGWETDDGGESWTRVATNGFVRDLACSEAGCINGDAQRVGWDLPVVQSPDKITAQSEPAKPEARPQAKPEVAAAPLELVCKPSGLTTPIASVPGSELLDGRTADVRWASVKRDGEGKVSIVVGSKTAVRELALLGPTPKATKGGPEHRGGDRVLPDGVVAARYSFAPKSATGVLNPVDVEIAWWSAATGRTSRHTLPKLKPFRVSSYGFSGTPQIVDGGLLFQPAYGEPVFFVRDSGKVETLTLPGGASLRNAERSGKRWVLADWDGTIAGLTWSDDNGTTWTQKSWGLDDGGSLQLTLLGTKPALSLSHTGSPNLLFNLDGAIPDEPPAPVVMATSEVDTPCDAQAGRLRLTTNIPYDRRNIRVRIEPTGADKTPVQLTASLRVTHDTASGKSCTAAYMAGGSQTAFVYPEAKGGWTGWRFIRSPSKTTKTTFVAETLACAPPK